MWIFKKICFCLFCKFLCNFKIWGLSIEGDIFVFFLTTERRVAQRSLVPPVLTPVAQRMRLWLAIICVPSPFRTASQYRANISLCLCSSSWLVEKETSSKYHSLYSACLTSWDFWRVWVGQVSLFLMIS